MNIKDSRVGVLGRPAFGPPAGTSIAANEGAAAPGRTGPTTTLDPQFEAEVPGTATTGALVKGRGLASASDLSCRDDEHCGGLPSRPTRLDLIADWIGLWDCLPHRHRMRIWKRLGMSLSTQRGDTP